MGGIRCYSEREFCVFKRPWQLHAFARSALVWSLLTVLQGLQGLQGKKGLSQDKKIDILGIHMVNGAYTGHPVGDVEV
eukprot:1162025-Pelagomonas_calceolata.AAC.13